MLFMIGGILIMLSGVSRYIWSYHSLKIVRWLEENSVENYKKYNELQRKKNIKRFYKDFDSGLIDLDGQSKKDLKTARISLNIGKVVFIVGLVFMVIHFAV